MTVHQHEPTHSPVVKRIPVVKGVTNALYLALREEIPEEFNFIFERDEPLLKQHTYPEISLYAPAWLRNGVVQTWAPVYKDFDLVALTVKEFKAPISRKLRYFLRTSCENPDTDELITTILTRLSEELVILTVLDDESGRTAKAVELIWHAPVDYVYAKGKKTRVWSIDASVNIERLKFKLRRLLNPLKPVNVTTQLMMTPITATLSNTIVPGATEVYLSEGTSRFPGHGSILFERNEEVVAYTTKDPYKLVLSSSIEHYHFWDEIVTYQP
jgi:hypothetical protein